MADRPLHLFAGPSLGVTTQAQLSTAGVVLHPPARRGDIRTLVTGDPGATIAIADGLFHQQPAVGHAEIRDAIRGGACVWGLCSMGAIRAAEMSHLGMRGFGEVFQAYSSDPCLPDDEVALLHHPQAPYVAISEPLIHWRRYFRAQEGSGALTPAKSERIQADLAGRWYGERTLEHGVAMLASICNVHIQPEAMDYALEPHRVKQRDLQEFIRTRPWDPPAPNARAVVTQIAAPAIDLDALGGLPFIDLSFDVERFLSAVAGTRAGLLGGVPPGSDGYVSWLEPQRAVNALTARIARSDFTPPNTELTAEEWQWAELALLRVKAGSKTLAALFELPIRVLRWKSARVSMTNPFIPQTIFLGDGALHSSFGILEEVWVHEFAHVWLGMMCEVSDMQKRDSLQAYTLPSGTGLKDARGVLLAAHFAGAVLTHLIDSAERVPLIGRRAERLHYVRWYLRLSLQIPIAADLTPIGHAVFERLKQLSELHARGG